jgi:excisionase family DNA binding protein
MPSELDILETDTYVPVQEMAVKLNCDPETLRIHLRAKRLPGIKVGRDWRVCHRQIVVAWGNGFFVTAVASSQVAA